MRRFVLAGLVSLACLAAPAVAQLAPMKMTSVYKQALKGRGRVAVPSYGISFVTAQRASANAGLDSQTRLRSALVGVDTATMRRLANEGYADLTAQLAAAGISVVPAEEARAILAAAGTTLRPGNTDDKQAGGGLPFGKTKISKGYVVVGADAAPLTTLFGAAGGGGPFAAFGAVGGTMKLNKPAGAADALLIFPQMVVDFADVDAKTGRTLAGGKRASIDSEVKFVVRGMESKVTTQNPSADGRFGTPGGFWPAQDYESDAPFSFGATERSAMSSATNVGGGMTSYQDSRSGGDGGVRVDLPKWTALVQEAYRAYNAAIVAALVSTR